MSYFSDLDIEVKEESWLITGDTHGNFTRFKTSLPRATDMNIIILGDAGLNYYLNKTDKKVKQFLKDEFSFLTIWCVRGNHEERPENITSMKITYNEKVSGYVYEEEEFPNIKYFKDGEEYFINGYRCLVIGGAYSVDKFYRLQHGGQWFKDEQLTPEERINIENKIKNNTYDFIFSHTCPLDWEPTELFLGGINQSQVDKTMEKWFNHLKNDCNLKWNYAWCFGHYHADQIVRPHVEMLFNDFEYLDNVKTRWERFNQEGYLDWWLYKSPRFYEGVS